MLSNAMFDVGGSFGHSTVIGAVINPVNWGAVAAAIWEGVEQFGEAQRW